MIIQKSRKKKRDSNFKMDHYLDMILLNFYGEQPRRYKKTHIQNNFRKLTSLFSREISFSMVREGKVNIKCNTYRVKRWLSRTGLVRANLSL